MSLRFKAGDLAILVSSLMQDDPDVGSVVEIIHVGPWNGGECSPTGQYLPEDTDYIIRTETIGEDGTALWAVDENQLAPLPGDSSSRSTDTAALDPAWKRMREFLQVAAEVQREKQKERV